jgi:predicted regulator of Ras-like GTPase activity (Roadblock/LC7/MglB family)
MGLQQILDELVAGAPGAMAAILADWEGEAVVLSANEGFDDYQIKVIGAHHGVLLQLARDLNKKLNLGDSRDITFLQDRFHVVTAPINHEYYLVLTLKPLSVPVLAKPAIQKAIRELYAEIN